MNKANIVIFVAMACAIGIGLAYNVRLAARLSHMENALRTMDEKLCVVKPRTNEVARMARDHFAIEIERKALYAAYQVEEADFNASHKMMGGWPHLIRNVLQCSE